MQTHVWERENRGERKEREEEKEKEEMREKKTSGGGRDNGWKWGIAKKEEMEGEGEKGREIEETEMPRDSVVFYYVYPVFIFWIIFCKTLFTLL